MSPTAGVKVSQFIGSWNNKSTAHLRCDVSARVKSCSKWPVLCFTLLYCRWDSEYTQQHTLDWPEIFFRAYWVVSVDTL